MSGDNAPCGEFDRSLFDRSIVRSFMMLMLIYFAQKMWLLLLPLRPWRLLSLPVVSFRMDCWFEFEFEFDFGRVRRYGYR